MGRKIKFTEKGKEEIIFLKEYFKSNRGIALILIESYNVANNF